MPACRYFDARIVNEAFTIVAARAIGAEHEWLKLGPLL